MNITTKYDLGQEVWTIRIEQERTQLPCKFCRGEKRVRVESPSGDYDYADCPRCKGYVPQVEVVAIPTWVLGRKLTIGQVRVHVTDSPGRPGEARFDNFKQQSGREEDYMCVETGIGSGNIHDVSKLFPTEAMAQEEADERNEAIAEGRGEWKPSHREATAAQAFLDHRDVYEHTPEDVALAERVIAAFETAQEEAPTPA